VTLSAGTKLGPYEILAPIGAGGMGEVYRARDERLKRDVAIKVLPAMFSADADRLRRFEQEAQSAGGLNHPNITAVYDFGSLEGAPYIVTELLEGETLRYRLSGGALAVRKATDYAVQIAHGLAAAHEKGIVHRDLKPENLFVTNDGRVKILDFGLAKLTQAHGDAQSGPQTNLPTATEPGVVMGTLGYMSPEQVKGKAADQRSDIFAFGAILYEMLSGQRAFHRDSAAETMSAILREEPPDLSATNRNLQPGLERIVRHCLEKSPEERFHSAHDLAFDLQALSGTTGSAAVAASPERVSRLRPIPLAAGVLALAAALAAGYFWGRSKGVSAPPTFRQLTFRRGAIWSARFGSDGKSILTTAAWDGKHAQIYVSRPESPESAAFGVPDAEVAAVASTGELAVLLRADFVSAFSRSGTLARVGATGGAARELLEKVQYADWTPDGKDLAIVRPWAAKCRLEFPAGKALYETTGWIANPRFSPRGDRIAFLDHPVVNDDGGTVAVVDLAGKKTTLSPEYASAFGLAWSPDGSEVWYTAAEVGANRALHAVTLSGKTRILARVSGNLTLHDVARDGRVLMDHDTNQVGVVARAAGSPRETDLTWLDWSLLNDISVDGRFILFTETGEGGGRGYSIYVRSLDGSPAVRLGEGNGQSISPDGKRVLALIGPAQSPDIIIYPTGAGEAKRIPVPGLSVRGLRWLPDGRRFLAVARETGHPARTYLFDAEGGAPRALTSEGYRANFISADGKRFGAYGPDNGAYIFAIDGGEPIRVPDVDVDDGIAGWAPDGRVYLRKGNASRIPAPIVILDPATGRQEPWRELVPADAAGINALQVFRFAPNGSYAYSYFRSLSNLFLVDGVR
jgi:Tol biopolymer transport system component